MTDIYSKHLLSHFFEKFNFIKKIKKVNKVYKDYQKAPDPQINSISENIAFLIDDEIVEIIHCQPKMASILLSNPKIIDIKNNNVKIGYRYLDNEFIDPHSIKSSYPHE
jgi:hypothetical protein